MRNRLAVAMFKAWWHPFSRYGVIHGDPHLGNYTVFARDGEPRGINLLDYGCIRIFPERFVGGVVDLYNGLLKGDRDRVVHAYETWGFKRLSRELIDILNIWAKFIYGPLLDDRERTIADGVKPSEYGRREAFAVHRALKQKGPDQGAARVRVHGPRRDRPRRRVPAPCRQAQLLPAVQRGDRAFLASRRSGRGRRRRSPRPGTAKPSERVPPAAPAGGPCTAFAASAVALRSHLR